MHLITIRQLIKELIILGLDDMSSKSSQLDIKLESAGYSQRRFDRDTF